ncbi:unannotated protein [freshwater metagenome]|uniref:Unannotated protein n=1 Tax=freshwater metagenome TaxID=449393 RepID=A0A6J7I6V5_9ZZZZ
MTMSQMPTTHASAMIDAGAVRMIMPPMMMTMPAKMFQPRPGWPLPSMPRNRIENPRNRNEMPMKIARIQPASSGGPGSQKSRRATNPRMSERAPVMMSSARMPPEIPEPKDRTISKMPVTINQMANSHERVSIASTGCMTQKMPTMMLMTPKKSSNHQLRPSADRAPASACASVGPAFTDAMSSSMLRGAREAPRYWENSRSATPERRLRHTLRQRVDFS